MKKLAKAGAPDFNDCENYTYFCVIVLPKIFEVLRKEKRLKQEDCLVKFGTEERKYCGETYEGEPTGMGTSTGSSNSTYTGAWIEGLPHGLVTLTFADG